jgi:hypothetical protein
MPLIFIGLEVIAMKMTLDEYIQNPLGTSAVVSGIVKESVRRVYTEKFNNILLRENGKIQHYKYVTDKNQYIIHIKIPSEVIKNFYYDVVFKFFTDAKVLDLGRSLNKYYFQVYSNDPAFVYTHAYVFNKNDLFFTDLKDKMGKIALSSKPKEKNPTEQLAYVKSIYFAYLFMLNRGLFKTILWKDAEKYEPSRLASNVMHSDKKVELRQKEGEKLDQRKKIVVDTAVARKISHLGVSEETKQRLVTTTNKVKSVKKTKAVNSTKRIIGKRKK